jgi:hypothetical protein
MSIDEMLERPVRMAFIQAEASDAWRRGLGTSMCRWPVNSHERRYWVEQYKLAKEKAPAVKPGLSIPHQRDAEMASTAAG